MCPCVSAEPEASVGPHCVSTLGEATQDGQGRALCDPPQISQLHFQVLAWRSLDPWTLLQPFFSPDGASYSLCIGPISSLCRCSDLGPRIPLEWCAGLTQPYPPPLHWAPHSCVPGLHPPQLPAHMTPFPHAPSHGMCLPSASLSALVGHIAWFSCAATSPLLPCLALHRTGPMHSRCPVTSLSWF